MKYTALVIETRTILCLYTIEAEDHYEALEKAKKGDTIKELQEPATAEVINRDVDEDSLHMVWPRYADNQQLPK